MASSACRRLAVFGGNGYVGQRICALAVDAGLDVVSLSRSGSGSLPASVRDAEWASKVDFVAGVDALEPATFAGALDGVDAVVVSIGSPPVPTRDAAATELQRRTNANAAVLEAIGDRTSEIGRVVVVSATMPQWAPQGYRQGKLEMEDALTSLVSAEGTSGTFGGVILRPAGVSGTRHESSMSVPLWVVMTPVSQAMQVLSTPLKALAKAAPSVFEGVVDPFVSVDAVARAALGGVTSDEYGGKLTILENDELLKA